MSLVRYEWNLLGPTDPRPVASLPRVAWSWRPEA